MLSRIREFEGWGYTTLHGNMSKKARNASIDKSKSDPTIKILIATLKTGGRGLNLTYARYTINVDPYWNTGGEIQAMSRTYMIGQEKEIGLVNLVGGHMKAIKLRKKLEVDQVNASHKRMPMEDLPETIDFAEENSDEDSFSNQIALIYDGNEA
ncbi:hypothetical protein D6D17_09743 [Aureobasidium pullulans]|nr:hypothetical protein D6D17_09743 [Aureobasidium pullulans]